MDIVIGLGKAFMEIFGVNETGVKIIIAIYIVSLIITIIQLIRGKIFLSYGPKEIAISSVLFFIAVYSICLAKWGVANQGWNPYTNWPIAIIAFVAFGFRGIALIFSEIGSYGITGLFFAITEVGAGLVGFCVAFLIGSAIFAICAVPFAIIFIAIIMSLSGSSRY